MNRKVNRREFLTNTALTGLGFLTARGSVLAQGNSANEKLNIGNYPCRRPGPGQYGQGHRREHRRPVRC